MIRAIRILAAVAVLAAVPPLLRVLTVIPWRCNVQRLHAQQYIDQWYSSPRRGDVVLQTREHLTRSFACEPYCAANAAMYMQRAALLRMLDRNDEATQTYREMLRHHQRPEIYLELGMMQLFDGQHDTAINTFCTATRFSPAILLSSNRRWGRWMSLPELSGVEEEVFARMRREDPDFGDPRGQPWD
jgi:tetratricopeptide (TPR) repeat protein